VWAHARRVPSWAPWSILVLTERYRVATAKLFRNGRSQAVRLPKDFRFEGDEVAIRREGRRVVL
jgi:antitoxin VapB